MTDDELVDLAEKAGSLTMIQYGVTSAKIEWLQKFADLVAAREREQCAKVCEQAGIDGYSTLAAAAMIRARGEK